MGEGGVGQSGTKFQHTVLVCVCVCSCACACACVHPARPCYLSISSLGGVVVSRGP